MRKILIGFILLVIIYHLAWPVPVDPAVWSPPVAPALEGDYAPNTYLADVERLELKYGYGPEDVAVDTLGRIYGGLQDGQIIRMAADGSQMETFADTGGRPLGLAFDATGTLIVADAYKGLLSVTPDGAIHVLTTEAEGVPFLFTDDVDIGPDGRIYFSDASYKFNQAEYKFDILENRPNGRLLEYNPADRSTRVLLHDLYFANGVAVSPDGSFLLVNETSRYRIQKYWLSGPKEGTSELLLDNLPGFPDGVSSNGEGLYWVAIVSPRNPLIDRLAPSPFLRKVVIRLPELLQPAPVRYAFVLGIDAEGTIVHNLQNPSGNPFSIISSVEQVDDELYLGSLSETALARIAAP